MANERKTSRILVSVTSEYLCELLKLPEGTFAYHLEFDPTVGKVHIHVVGDSLDEFIPEGTEASFYSIKEVGATDD